MDFKKLLSQLDTIEQRQLLKESEELLERAHIKDVEATASITDKAQRYAALAKLAKDGKYVGMFDPVTGNFIDQNGNAAWFGAYKDEVAQLAKHGLIPDSAKEKTSHFLGMMGMDKKEAGAIQTDVRTREQAIQKATGLIDKALESLKAQPSAYIVNLQTKMIQDIEVRVILCLLQQRLESFEMFFIRYPSTCLRS